MSESGRGKVYKCTLQKKLAELTKFRHLDGMFMDLTVLANFSLIIESEITLAELKVLPTFCSSELRKLSRRIRFLHICELITSPSL